MDDPRYEHCICHGTGMVHLPATMTSPAETEYCPCPRGDEAQEAMEGDADE